MSGSEAPSEDFKDVEAVILAGGQSRRMGRDKAGLAIGGERLLARLAREFQTVGIPVRLAVGERSRLPLATDLGLEAVVDARPGDGPLRGIEAALRRLQRDWLLVWTCDAPGLPLAALAPLLAQARAAAASAAAFATAEGPEPLLACYHRRCLVELAAYLEHGGRAAHEFLARVGALVLPCGKLGISAADLRSLNLPEDLAAEARP